ncbi:MAG: hypothetical protein O7E52_14240 [Candidatus Poribacteria bacterium]|nr:hypothetical protein [Candidatus Poribacteria bacterium]
MVLQSRFLSVYLVLCLIYAVFPFIAAEAPNKKLTSKDFYHQMSYAAHGVAFDDAHQQGRSGLGQNGTAAPFTNLDFLLEEIQRMNQSAGE